MDQAEATFIRIVEAGSLRAAALQLGTDPSSISRRLVMLEQRLGVKLLQRSTRRSTPTEAGALYYEGLRRIADEQSALEAAVAGQANTPSGLLRVSAPLDFGVRFVAPVLQTMQRDFPELTIEALMGSEFEDLTTKNIDVAVRVGSLQDSSLICRKLGDVPRVLVAAETYLAQRGVPEQPEDLSGHNFIFYTRRQADAPITLLGPDGLETIKVSGSIAINSVRAIRNLVEQGLGIHMGPMWAFEDGISAKRLVAVLPQYRIEPYPLHVLYHSSEFVPAKIRRFVDGLAEQLSADKSKIAA